MVTQVNTPDGKHAAVLDESDLSAAKDWFIKWLLRAFGTAVIAAGALATYTVKAEMRDQNLRAGVDSNTAVIRRMMEVHVDLIREVDSTRIELRHIAQSLEKIEAKLDRNYRQ